MFGILKAFSSPKKFFAAMVDGMIDRLNDKYKLKITAEIEILDKRPGEPGPLEEAERKAK